MDPKTETVVAVVEETAKTGLFTPKRVIAAVAIAAFVTAGVLIVKKLRAGEEPEE